jgi:hypothetical protein
MTNLTNLCQHNAYGHTNGFTLGICFAIVGYGSSKKHFIMCSIVTRKHQHPRSLRYSHTSLSIERNIKYWKFQTSFIFSFLHITRDPYASFTRTWGGSSLWFGYCNIVLPGKLKLTWLYNILHVSNPHGICLMSRWKQFQKPH